MFYDLSGGRLGRDLRTALVVALRPAVSGEDWDLIRRQRTSDLLITYLTWQHRLIPATPRSLLTTDRFDRRRADIDGTAQRRLCRLLAIIESGTDLTPYLSKRVATAWAGHHPKTPTQHRQHLDSLLFGWGIHHLHLRTPGRGDELLLGIFSDDEALLIDVGDHEDFDDETLVVDAIRRAPHLFHSLQPGTSLVTDVSGHHADLRNHGISTMFEVDGRVYAPRGIGLSVAGTPFQATRSSNQVMHILARLGADPHTQTEALFGEPFDLRTIRAHLRGPQVLLTDGVRTACIT